MAASQRHRPPARDGFSLLEVVVAVGIFAVGMMGVVALFAPVARSVGGSADAEVAARVADALRTKLQAMPFTEVVALLKNSNDTRHDLTDADARSDYNPATDGQLLFANRDGSKIATYGDPIWGPRTAALNPDREKFFEIALVRNEALSPRAAPPSEPVEGGEMVIPADPDATAFMLAYTARLRWPAFVRDGGTGATQVGSNPSAPVRFDHSMKQVLFFTGSITR